MVLACSLPISRPSAVSAPRRVVVGRPMPAQPMRVASRTQRTPCRAVPRPHTRPSVNMTLISGSLSSYDDPFENPIDPAPMTYLLLTVAHAALGLYMLLRPEAVIQTVYAASAANSLVTSLVTMLGGFHLYGAAFCHALHGAAENSRLDSTTYRRLAFGGF